jgi:hypothetical protein
MTSGSPSLSGVQGFVAIDIEPIKKMPKISKCLNCLKLMYTDDFIYKDHLVHYGIDCLMFQWPEVHA